MKKIKYFFQFILIIFLFTLYKCLGLKLSLILSSKIFKLAGPIFRKNQISEQNLTYAFKNINNKIKQKIIREMWANYGKIFAEYMFIKDFRNDPKISKKINIENKEILEKIKNNSEPVVFISGHFNNFEFMAMQIEKYGIELATIYRPLNNIFLNPFMEYLRKKYVCKNQIKKGVNGVREVYSGYAGGFTKNPNYNQIGTGRTGHAEAVEVIYNPKIVSFETLLKVFFGSHDPTTPNRQGPDFGSQYRSIAFYTSNEERIILSRFINKIINELKTAPSK